jgi:predicted DNA-binding protein YlxM (UPF0122 family)
MYLQWRNLGQGTTLHLQALAKNSTVMRRAVASAAVPKQTIAGKQTMLDEITLRRLYLDEQRSIREISQLVHVSTRSIYDALIHYRIPRRASGFRSPQAQPAKKALDEATLRHLYLEEERSIRDIAALCQVSTRMVYDTMGRYNIARRTSGYRKPRPRMLELAAGTIDEATLRRMYEEEGQSIAAIAAAVSCAPSRIRNALVRWQIARRKRGRQPGGSFTTQAFPLAQKKPPSQPL